MSTLADKGLYAVPPDGGWGWMIVFSVFMANFLIDGIVACFGLLFPHLLLAFDATPAVTSLAGSTIVGTYLFIAPIVGMLVERFYSRPVAFVGGCICSIGLFLATMATSFETFIIFYGVIGGCGLGMNSLPGYVMVSLYFEKQRGIAQGIVTAGAGCGVLVMAPLTQLLLEEYGWRGTLLLMSGLGLQFCVFAALLRPITCEEQTGPDVIVTEEATGASDEVQKIGNSQDADRHTENFNKEAKVALLYGGSYYSNVRSSDTQIPERIKSLADDSKGLLTPNLTRKMAGYSPTDTSSLPNLAGRSDYLQLAPQPHSKKIHHVNPMLRKNIFYSGSLYRLKEFTSQPSVKGYVESMTRQDLVREEETSAIQHRRCPRYKTCELCDVSVFRNKFYTPLLIGAVLIQMAQFIPTTFIADYGTSIGLTQSQVSLVLAIYGALNILGRLSAGCLANIRWIDVLWLCNFGFAMCGLACAIFRFCTTFTSLCVFAMLLGYFIGYFPPLQILIMVKYLGVNKLSSSLGFMNMVKGPAALAGPPLAGAIYEWTGDYGMAVMFAAGLSFLAAIVQSMIPLINRKCTCASTSVVMTREIKVTDYDDSEDKE